ADLRFADREAAALLHGAGATLDHEAVEALNARVEGWPMGLSLAAQSLTSSEAGDSGAMLEYLRRAVLERLSEAEVRVLPRVSVLERVWGALCDVVAEASGSSELLERLERSNFFVVPLDSERCWYRLHGVFRTLLRTELERREPGLERTLR